MLRWSLPRLAALLIITVPSAMAKSPPAPSSQPPTLCQRTERIIISGETARGYASLCATGNIWHFRFGRPSHITYVFPHSNSPAQMNFFWGVNAFSPTSGGYDYSFIDNGARVFLFHYGSLQRDNNAPMVKTGLIKIHNETIIESLPFLTTRKENEFGAQYANHTHIPLLLREDPTHYPHGFQPPEPFQTILPPSSLRPSSPTTNHAP